MLDLVLRESWVQLVRQARFHSERDHDHEDAIGEACIRFLQAFDGQTADEARRWLLAVVKVCAWAIARRRREHSTVVREGFAEHRGADAQGASIGVPGPDQLVDGVIGRVEALARLKRDERRVLVLLGAGFSFAEIGAAEGWTYTKIKRCSYEGRRRLRQICGKGGRSMRLAHSSGMDGVTTIEFAEALSRLQGLLGSELQIQLTFRGTFGGSLMRGRLSRVDTLPPDREAVSVLLDERQSLVLDPIDTEVLEVGDVDSGRHWLEFHLPSGVMAMVEQV